MNSANSAPSSTEMRSVAPWQIPYTLVPLSQQIAEQGGNRQQLYSATRELYNQVRVAAPVVVQHQPIDRRISSNASAKNVRY